MLLTFILSQRKNIPAIRKAVEDLSQVYGEKQEVAGQTVFFFPSPEALKPVHEETFRQMGMGYRAPYLVDAVQRVVDQRLNLKELEQVSTPDLLHALMQVHGVGTKVAHCVALYGFGRMTSAPIDVWISRAIHEQFHDVNPFPAFGESAGIMQQYVFYAMHDHMPTETGKGKVDRG